MRARARQLLLWWTILLVAGGRIVSSPDHHDANTESGPAGAGGLFDGARGNYTAVVNWGSGGDCSSAPSANIRYLHGAWMAGSWSTCIAAGVFVARYCRHQPWWMTVHIQLMTIGSLGTAGFAAVAIAMVQPGNQMLSTHHVLGGVIGALTLVQASAGKYVHELQKSEKSHGLGRGLAIVHRVLGKLLLAAAAYNIYTGIDMLIAAFTPWFLGWAAVVVALFVSAEARLQLCPPALASGGNPPECSETQTATSSCIVCVSACAGKKADALAIHSARHGVADARTASSPQPEAGAPRSQTPRSQTPSRRRELDVYEQVSRSRSPDPRSREVRHTGSSPRTPPPHAGAGILSRVPPPLTAAKREWSL